jgi:hypothetical protein
MCCSRAMRAFSDFTRASFAARSSPSYSSFAEVPNFFRSSVTAPENFAVLLSYSVAKRFFSSQFMVRFTLKWSNDPEPSILKFVHLRLVLRK